MNLRDYEQKFDNFGDDYHSNYKQSFPLAVFGTLRQIPTGQGNLHLMLAREPIGHRKAFIPHMLPSGIWVEHEHGASGIFEVFFYNDEDFPVVIKGVDRLEGFDPDHYYGYHRTLLRARLLPDDYDEELYNRGIRWSNRTLDIPEDEWSQFDSVPAWSYSNPDMNQQLALEENSPLLWVH